MNFQLYLQLILVLCYTINASNISPKERAPMLSWISHSSAFSCHHTLSLDSLTKTSSLCYLLYIHQPDKLWGIIHASATAAQLLEVQTASAKY